MFFYVLKHKVPSYLTHTLMLWLAEHVVSNIQIGSDRQNTSSYHRTKSPQQQGLAYIGVQMQLQIYVTDDINLGLWILLNLRRIIGFSHKQSLIPLSWNFYNKS